MWRRIAAVLSVSAGVRALVVPQCRGRHAVGRSACFPRDARAAAGPAVIAATARDDRATTLRPPYALSDLPRPKLRGAVMGYLHRSKLWYLVASCYVVAALCAAPLNIGDAALRLAMASASSLSVLTSHGYHNPDRRRAGDVTPESELFWLRWDYIGISAILSTQIWLWAANLGWTTGLPTVAALAALATASISTACFTLVPKRAGHVAVKLTFAFQFVGLLGFLVTKAIFSPLKACALIYLCYLPGFILYATKWPKQGTFGYHEYFHVSVLLGHLVSMGFDLGLLLAA